MKASRSKLSTRLRRAPTRYEPRARLAAGGMAEVWRADAVFEDGERHPVAIKRVLPKLAAQEIYHSMFEDEARLGMALRHPNIVRVYDARDVGGTFIMIMELVDGASLKQLLDRAQARRAPMPVATALYIARELAKALDYAHTATDREGKALGIIHRDVSPHNLLLSRAGDVKLADFGLADANVHETQLGDGMLGGKLGYLAPEIIRQEPTTHQIDLFAVGIVLWEMLSGRRLFVGETDADTVRAVARCEVSPARAHNRGVTEPVEAFLREILASDPDDRILTAASAVAHLDALLAEVDPDVGPRDVALLVGLFLATEAVREPAAPQALADLLAQELAAFAGAAASAGGPIGATPLESGLVPARLSIDRSWTRGALQRRRGSRADCPPRADLPRFHPCSLGPDGPTRRRPPRRSRPARRGSARAGDEATRSAALDGPASVRSAQPEDDGVPHAAAGRAGLDAVLGAPRGAGGGTAVEVERLVAAFVDELAREGVEARPGAPSCAVAARHVDVELPALVANAERRAGRGRRRATADVVRAVDHQAGPALDRERGMRGQDQGVGLGVVEGRVVVVRDGDHAAADTGHERAQRTVARHHQPLRRAVGAIEAAVDDQRRAFAHPSREVATHVRVDDPDLGPAERERPAVEVVGLAVGAMRGADGRLERSPRRRLRARGHGARQRHHARQRGHPSARPSTFTHRNESVASRSHPHELPSVQFLRAAHPMRGLSMLRSRRPVDRAASRARTFAVGARSRRRDSVLREVLRETETGDQPAKVAIQ